jgi:DNA-binding MarR family transcriptional regulator
MVMMSPKHKVNVLDACDVLGLKKSLVSLYFKRLSEAGFLRVERSGRYVICSTTLDGRSKIERLQVALKELLSRKKEQHWTEPIIRKLNALTHHGRIRILRFISENNEVVFDDLVAGVGMPKTTVFRQLGILVQAGFVEVNSENIQHSYKLLKQKELLFHVLLSFALDVRFRN